MTSGKDSTHMRAIENLVGAAAATSAGKMTFSFLQRSSYEIRL